MKKLIAKFKADRAVKRQVQSDVSNLETSDKVIYYAASATTTFIAICAFALSYNSLYTLAIRSEVPAELAFIYPLVLDGLLLIGSLQILYAATRGKRSAGGVFLVILGVASSVAGNIVISPPTLTAQLVHAAGPVVLFLSLESLTFLIRQRRIQQSATALAGQRVEVVLPVQEPSATESTFTPVPAPAVAEVAMSPQVSAPVAITDSTQTANGALTTSDAPSRMEKSQFFAVESAESEEVVPDVKRTALPLPRKNLSFAKSDESAVEGAVASVEETKVESAPVIASKPATTPVPPSAVKQGAKQPTLAQQIRALIQEKPEISLAEIEERVSSSDIKYLRKIARREMSEATQGR